MTAWADLIMCTLDEFYDVVDQNTVRGLTNSSSSEEADAKVLKIIDRAKNNFVLPELKSRLSKDYPDSADAIVTFHNGLIDAVRMRLRKSFAETGVNALTPPVGMVTTEDLIQEQMFPNAVSTNLHYNNGAPTSGSGGTQAGFAENGDFLIDYAAWQAYINRGSKTSPDWQAWDTDLLVNYILNPDELHEAVKLKAVELLFEKKSSTDDGYTENNLEAFTKKIERIRKSQREAMALALDNLKVDASGDGLISSFEHNRSGETLPFA